VCLVSRKRLSRRINSTVVVVALVVTALDAVTKAWARSSLRSGGEHLFGPLWLRLRFNSGISFSVAQSRSMITTVLTIVIALVVLGCALIAQRGLATAGFGLLLGGGVGNLIDRLMATPHEVTDFVAVGSFPVFNLADASITVGFVVLLVASLRGEKLLNR
jgi:signal peptidase II